MRRREFVTAVLVSTTVGFALAALGSVPRWAVCAGAALAILAAAPQVTSRRAPALVSPLLVLIGMALAFTALQLVPLPAAVVGLLSPAKLEIVRDNAAAFGQAAPGFLSLSFDPPATAVELAKLAGYLALAFAAMRVAAHERGRVWIVRTVAGAGLAMAVCAVAHHLFGVRELFGLYRPQQISHTYLAPLLNQNHLAGFLAFTVPLSVALAATERGPLRPLWVTAATVCSGTVLLTNSRGGAVALVVAGVATAVLLLLQRRRRQSEHQRSERVELSVAIPAGVVLTCAVILVATLTAGGVRDEFAATTLDEVSDPNSKFGIWRAGSTLIDENLWAGVGRGAFEVAFTRYHHSGVKTYSHAENEYLQALVDWGLPAVAALALIALWVLLLALRRWRRSPIEAGAVAALVTIAVQNVFDFNLELPGVATAVLVVLAALSAPPLKKVASPRQRRLVAGRGLALLGATLVVVLAASPFGRSRYADGEEVKAWVDAVREAEPGDRDRAALTAIAAGLEAWSRHPADYVLAGLTAEAYYQKPDARGAARTVNRALFLNPRSPALHVLTARILKNLANQPEQALIEFSLAMQHTMEPEKSLRDLLRLFPDAERAARGIPIAPDRVPIMTGRLITLGRRDVALAYARRALDENENDIDILTRVAELALEHGDIPLARRAGERLHTDRGTLRDAVLFGRALRAGGELETALAILREAASRDEPDADARTGFELYLAMSDVEIELGKFDDARLSLDSALALADNAAARLAGIYHRMARIETASGDPERADQLRNRAKELDSR